MSNLGERLRSLASQGISPSRTLEAITRVTGLFLTANAASFIGLSPDIPTEVLTSHGMLVAATALSIPCSLLLTLGIWRTPALAGSLLSLATLGHAAPDLVAGDYIFSNISFWLLLYFAGMPQAIIPREKHATLTLALIILQLSLVLGINGWLKTGEAWDTGLAVERLLANPRWGRFSFCADSPTLEHSLRASSHAFLWTERLFPALASIQLFRLYSLRRRPCIDIVNIAGSALCIAVGTGMLAFANVGWFAPYTFIVASLILVARRKPSASATAPHHQAPPTPFRKATWLFAAAIGLTSMLAGSTATATKHPVQTLERWRDISNTRQPWRMFTPDVPRTTVLLKVTATKTDGATLVLLSERELQSALSPLRYRRGYKFNENLLRKEALRSRYADAKCRADPTLRSVTFHKLISESSFHCKERLHREVSSGSHKCQLK